VSTTTTCPTCNGTGQITTLDDAFTRPETVTSDLVDTPTFDNEDDARAWLTSVGAEPTANAIANVMAPPTPADTATAGGDDDHGAQGSDPVPPATVDPSVGTMTPPPQTG
jgi:hypothetical protein